MLNSVVTILTSAGVSSVLTAGLLWISKTWMEERLKNSIKSEYDHKIEDHKAILKAEYLNSTAKLWKKRI